MWLVGTILNSEILDLTIDLQKTQKDDENVQLTMETESAKS